MMTDKRMPRDAATIRHRIGTALTVLAALAAAWTAVVLLSGGIDIRAGAWRVVSRDPLRPLGVTMVFAALAWGLLGAAGARRRFAAMAGGRDRAAARIAAVVALATLVVAIAWN